MKEVVSLAKNESPVEIQKRAEKRFERTKRQEKVKENRKIIKEFNRQERNARLPGFIITIIVFVLFIGVFTGLYTQYDYELELKPKEFTEINIVESSEVLSAQLNNAFFTFFTTLNDVSSLADTTFNFVFSNNDLSDKPDVNLYLLSLKQKALVDISEKNIFIRYIMQSGLDIELKAYANPDALLIKKGYFIKGRFHKDYAHLLELKSYSELYPSWDVEKIHNDFVDLEICHRYNGELYKYCNH